MELKKIIKCVALLMLSFSANSYSNEMQNIEIKNCIVVVEQGRWQTRYINLKNIDQLTRKRANLAFEYGDDVTAILQLSEGQIRKIIKKYIECNDS